MRRAVGRIDELWDGDMRSVLIGHVRVLLLKQSGRVLAYEDRCPHLGAPLSKGRFERGVLTCAAHEYEYDACTGAGINPKNLCLRRFEVTVEDGVIVVSVHGDIGREALAERVGPVLEAGDVARGVIAAIRRCNQSVEVRDRGAYLRVLVPERCQVTRAAIEQELGRPFRLPGELEAIMPSFSGEFRVSEADAVWEARSS